MYEFGDLFCSSDFIGRSPELTNTTSLPEFFPAPVPCPTTIPFVAGKVVGDDYDSVREVLAALTSDIGNSNSNSNSNSSSCSTYVQLGSSSSLPYCYPQRPSLIQRCMSSQSLPNDSFHYHGHNPIFSSPDESVLENFEFNDGPMRKVFSTGDLQTINLSQQQHSHRHQPDSPLSHDNCNIEGTKKVRCYSAQERKERIERYRSKRSQRNFNKKIKIFSNGRISPAHIQRLETPHSMHRYACQGVSRLWMLTGEDKIPPSTKETFASRKTLADSRPRIRGRFARNEEIGESIQTQWSQIGGEEDEEDDDVWINFVGAFSNPSPIT